MRTLSSDEAMLGYALFLSAVYAVLFLYIGLGAFAYSASAPAPLGPEEHPSILLVKQRTAPATTITLVAGGAMLVNTNPFPRAEVELVFMEMLQRKPVPALIIRCERGVRQSELMEILSKARKAGIREIRLVVAWEGGQK